MTRRHLSWDLALQTSASHQQLVPRKWRREQFKSADTIRNCFAHGGFYEALDGKHEIVIGPPERMQKKEYEEWMSIDENIPVTATLIGLEICQAICEQYQAIKVDDSEGDECVEENPPTNTEMRQALNILKRGVQHPLTNFQKTTRVRTIYK
ncbi:hypothetical protein AVEN_49405-1 [Araneus ventricosus]|uniref:Uncharacterized protein n=1 Tax=Araneus ventricosus TaxID=182803 RepID=A0A4Y2CQF1_ARAVE|nr:hypothetical protein AVEN_49405-1 [Araneus ventricosus]